MSTKRRNRSRWDSSRSPVVSPSITPAAPAPDAAAPAVAALSPAPPQGRGPNASTPLPVSEFSMDYRYELSLPAQMLISRQERQPWSDPGSDYPNAFSSRDSTGYGRHGSYYGSLLGSPPSQLEDYASGLHNSEVLQRNPASAQFVPGTASEAPLYLDPVRERRHMAGYCGQNPSFYDLSSGHGDVGHHALQLARTAEFSSERGLGGSAFGTTLIDSQAGGALLIAGREDVSKDIKGRDSVDKLPIGSSDHTFSTVHQKQDHLQAHRNHNEEASQSEVTARVAKDNMVHEHKNQFQSSLSASEGSQKKAEEVQPNEIQKNNAESMDGKHISEMLEPLERHKGGTSTPSRMRQHDTRKDAELLTRKPRESKNFRAPTRYTPY